MKTIHLCRTLKYSNGTFTSVSDTAMVKYSTYFTSLTTDHLDMLINIISKLEDGMVKPYVDHTVSLQDSVQEMKQLGGHYLVSVVMTNSL